MAFSRLQLHEVNVTAVRGSVSVCVCLLQGAKLLQMSICGVHNPPEPTHTCAALLLPPLTHTYAEIHLRTSNARCIPAQLAESFSGCSSVQAPFA